MWDTDIQDRPWIDLVPPDAAVPEFKYGRLVAVTFWSVIQDTGKEVVRHLEKHIPGQNEIHHGVYVGTQKDLGRQAGLMDFPETEPYANLVTDGQVISLPDMQDASTVAYIPNIRPNRIWRQHGAASGAIGSQRLFWSRGIDGCSRRSAMRRRSDGNSHRSRLVELPRSPCR